MGSDPRAAWHEGSGNAMLARLLAGEPVAMLGVRSSRTPDIARMAAVTGHHAVWIDLEHSTIGLDATAQICMAALESGLTPLVRIPEQDLGVIGRVLDGGALGVIAPRVETPAQAAEVAAACRFPPAGHRSAVATLGHLGWRRLPAAALHELLDRHTLVKVLIESEPGLEAIEAIASVPGVDLVGIGTNDLCAELGVPGDARHPRVRAAFEHALQACRRAGKPLAIGGIADPAYAAELMRAGAVPLLMTGFDTDILLAGLQGRVDAALASFTPSCEHPRP